MIKDRLKQARNSLGMSQAKIAELCSIPQTTYSKYENGGAIPESIMLVLAKFGFNLHWLITGSGNMFLDDSKSVSIELADTKVSYISAKGSTVTVEIPDGGLSIPIITQKLSAGPGQPWTQDDIIDGERLPIISRFIKPWNKDRVFAAEVRGDSMSGIQMFDGDMVIFVRGEVEGDGIYVITVDDEVYVKRVAFNPFDRKVTIKSENDRYDPITVDADRITLVGKVIGWLHHHPY